MKKFFYFIGLFFFVFSFFYSLLCTAQNLNEIRNLRAGTENVYGIVGLSKALDIAYNHLDEHRKHIESIKKYMIIKLIERIPGVEFNGLSNIMEKSLYTILNVKFPKCDIGDMLLYNLDILGRVINPINNRNIGFDIYDDGTVNRRF